MEILNGRHIMELLLNILYTALGLIMYITTFHIFHSIKGGRFQTKSIIITISVLIFTITLLTFGINSVFFHKEIRAIGLNTPCLANDDNKIYHSLDCKYKENTPFESVLHVSITEDEECPFCTVDERIHNECYVTEHGSHFHHSGCRYLNNRSTKTITIYNAFQKGYDVCSYCERYFNDILSKKCITTTWGNYFHNHSCKYIYTIDGYELTETNVYEATNNCYEACILCEIEDIDTSFIIENNYKASVVISSIVVIAVFYSIYIICNLITLKNHKNKTN